MLEFAVGERSIWWGLEPRQTEFLKAGHTY